MDAEQVTGPVAYHAEGPVWSNGLRFVDMFAGDVLTVSPDGEVARRNISTFVGAMRPRETGGFIYAVERGFACDVGDRSDVEEMGGHLWDTPEVRMNEGACSPDGAFFAGSMSRDQRTPAGTLYRFDGSSVEAVLTGVTVSNGIDWSPDGLLAYYADSATGRVDVFDSLPSSPWLAERRVFAVPAANGASKPDGLTVDSEGGVWVALYGGSAVHRYDPSGELTEVVEIPVRLVTSCCFGGEDLSDLYITTSRENLAPDEQPDAGSIFLARPDVRGLPVRPFAG